MTSKRLIAYASENNYPLLCIYGGTETKEYDEGSIKYLSLKRSALSFPLDEGLKYDPLYQRHTSRVLKAIFDFKPDIFHITGLNDVSIMGAYLSWKLDMPMVGSWHTNLHEFAGRRLERMFRFMPGEAASKISSFAERKIFDGAMLYYKMPKILMAPNSELIEELERRTKRETHLMSRGVDTEKFDPVKRTVSDGKIRLGYVGRLRAEKNVRLLYDLEQGIIGKTKRDYELLVVGEGNERDWLEKNLVNATFTGFLEGEPLSEAYANMDIFIFPSETDSFGNVAQEANASGVPSLVTNFGGPKYIIEPNETGFVCHNKEDFIRYSLELMDNPEKLLKMKEASRALALSKSWNSVFSSVYATYRECIRQKSQ